MDQWPESLAKFVKVFPNEYKRALGQRHAAAAPQSQTPAVHDDRAAGPRGSLQRKSVPAK
jgi:glutamate synthase (NADPH/NADH) large chain/glutamate synthase (ferredoxin)